MALAVDMVRSFDSSSPFAGLTTVSVSVTTAGRTVDGAQLTVSNSSITFPVSSGISCSSSCGGSRVVQRLIVGMADFITSPVNTVITWAGNYGLSGQINHAGDGRLYASCGFAQGGDSGGDSSSISDGTVISMGSWRFMELYMDFESEVCPTGDPSIVEVSFDMTLGGRVNMAPTSEMPVVSFGETLTRAVGAAQPLFTTARFVQCGSRKIDDLYAAHMDDCADAIEFLGDLRVNSDDSTYSQTASDARETHEVTEVALYHTGFQLRETHEVLEVVQGARVPSVATFLPQYIKTAKPG